MTDTNPNAGNQGTPGGQQKPTLSWSQPQASTTKPAAVQNNAKPAAPAATPVKTPASAAAASESSSAGTYIGIFVAGIIVGALIGWGISSSKNNVGSTSTTASSTNEASGTANTTSTGGAQKGSTGVDLSGSTVGSSGSLTLASSEPAGFAVAVSKVSVSAPTWLVVYEDHAGVPGNAIGAGLFFPGSTSGTIQLLRATLPGQSYFVGQSLDDGDKVFSLSTDKPVRDSKGNPLFTEFTAQ